MLRPAARRRLRMGERREEVVDVTGAERPGEHEALAAVALLFLQLAELLVLLDALGERLQAELLAELHERVEERPRLDRVGDRRDERTVDLQDVDRELAQVRERRVAGAEVVDRDADAERPSRRAAGARSISASRMIAVSVISITRADGSSPAASSAARRSSTRCSSSSWRAETLTDTYMFALGQAPLGACRHASLSTQRPTSTICFVSSSSGMNVSGCTTPRTGWFQRTSASTPSTRPYSRSKIGWYTRKNSPRSIAAAEVELEGEPVLDRGLHLALERDVAIAARGLRFVQRDVGVAQQVGRRAMRLPNAMPMLAVMRSVPRGASSISNGSRSTSSRRSATNSGLPVGAPPSTSTTNSSPPRRAIVSASRSVAEQPRRDRLAGAGRRRRARACR